MAVWVPNPHTTYDDDLLMTKDGDVIGRVEYFGGTCHYPTARNAATGNYERGGPFSDGVEARLWVERVAGLHPTKPGDERVPFYYTPEKPQ